MRLILGKEAEGLGSLFGILYFEAEDLFYRLKLDWRITVLPAGHLSLTILDMIMSFSSQLLIPWLQLDCSSALSAWICLVNRRWKKQKFLRQKYCFESKNSHSKVSEVKGDSFFCHAICKLLVALKFGRSVFSGRSGPLYTSGVILTFMWQRHYTSVVL